MFPYVIAFTNETMEIRLLVNGNLVHVTTMGELKLITNKGDIFFTTTAPEFIHRSSKIKGLEFDELPLTNNSNGGGEAIIAPQHPKVYPKINEISDERIMEIKSKIEKIEAKSLESCESQESQDDFHIYHSKEHEGLVNQRDHLDRLVVMDASALPSIQRARSLQGKDNKHKDFFEDKRRQISKSNSCGESTIVTNGVLTPTNDHIKAQEPSVPPNSPKVRETAQLQGSPKGKHSNAESSPAKIKPLRIYRIPLANLIGTSHHSTNLHNSFTNPTKIQSSKIPEDHREDCESGGNRFKEDEAL